MHFERLVRTIKTSLSSAITRKLYNIEEFTTIVKEVESIVNMRPLTNQSTKIRGQPLTPSQLLWGRDISIMPPLLQPDTDDSINETRELRHQYYLLSNALDRFRRRWSSEYLTSLCEKHLNLCKQKPMRHLNPGSLVMVRHENLHRYEWLLGKVVRVFPDPHGIIWSAEVEEGGKVSLRTQYLFLFHSNSIAMTTRGIPTKLRWLATTKKHHSARQTSLQPTNSNQQ